MIRDLHDFGKVLVRGVSRNLETVTGENFLIFPIELVAVSMTLGNLCFSVNPLGQRVLLENTRISSQPHRSTHFPDTQQFAKFINDTVGTGRIKFRAMGIQGAHVTRKLDHRALHPQTDSQIGNFVDASILNASNHPLDPPGTKSTRHQNTVHLFQLAFPIFAHQPF